MVEWFLKNFNKCFRDCFFRAGDVFFNLRIFVKFVKYLFKAYVFLLFVIILLFSWRMIVLAVSLLLEKRGYAVFQNFLVSVILLEFTLLKYCCFSFLRTSAIYSVWFLVLQVYASAIFIEFVTQFRSYYDFFS